jgi:hypothetical protein
MDKRVSKVPEYHTALLFDELYEVSPTFDRSACDTASFNRLKARLMVGCEILELLLIYQRFTAKAKNLGMSELPIQGAQEQQ